MIIAVANSPNNRVQLLHHSPFFPDFFIAVLESFVQRAFFRAGNVTLFDLVRIGIYTLSADFNYLFFFFFFPYLIRKILECKNSFLDTTQQSRTFYLNKAQLRLNKTTFGYIDKMHVCFKIRVLMGLADSNAWQLSSLRFFCISLAVQFSHIFFPLMSSVSLLNPYQKTRQKTLIYFKYLRFSIFFFFSPFSCLL